MRLSLYALRGKEREREREKENNIKDWQENINTGC